VIQRRCRFGAGGVADVVEVADIIELVVAVAGDVVVVAVTFAAVVGLDVGDGNGFRPGNSIDIWVRVGACDGVAVAPGG